MMFLMINMSHRWTETSVEAVAVAGLIGIIGVVTIGGCLYRLRQQKAGRGKAVSDHNCF